MVRIRSEHAIGFLKGRFQSPKSPCVQIKDKKSHQLATYWVAACICIHSFAMQHKAEEMAQDSNHEAGMSEQELDPFILEGLSSDTSSDDGERNQRFAPARLQKAKAKREQLKRRLFRAREHRRVQSELALADLIYSDD
jgi:hypothetical protein